MAKGRRARRVKPRPRAGGPETATARSARPEDEMLSRIDALRDEVRAAAEDRRSRSATPTPPGTRRVAGKPIPVVLDGPPGGGTDGPLRKASGGPPRKAGAGAGGPEVAAPLGASRAEGTAVIPPAKPVRTGPIGNRPQLNPPYPRPQRRHRALSLAAAVGLVAMVGVVVGFLITGGSSHRGSPIAAYLTANVPAGTVVATVGAGSGSRLSKSVPSGYPTVDVSPSSLETAASARYVVTTDPLTAEGSALAVWVHEHARLLAAEPGVAALWQITSLPPAAATPASTPTTTRSPTGSRPTSPTVIPGPAPSASTPPASSPPPSTSVPPNGTAPSSRGSPTLSSGTSSGSAATSVVVATGQSFWSIAQSVLTQHLGVVPTPTQVGSYWAQLIAANADHLPVPGNPNLLYPGTTLVLPAVG